MQRQLTDEEERAIDILVGPRASAVCLLPDFDQEVEGKEILRLEDTVVIVDDESDDEETACCGVCGDEYNRKDELAAGNTGDMCRHHWETRFGQPRDSNSGSSSDDSSSSDSDATCDYEGVKRPKVTEMDRVNARENFMKNFRLVKSSVLPPIYSQVVDLSNDSSDDELSVKETSGKRNREADAVPERPNHPTPPKCRMKAFTPIRVATGPDTPASALDQTFKKEIYELNLMQSAAYRRCEGCAIKAPDQRSHMGAYGCLSLSS
jgi:hypothetical protein